MLLVMNVCSVKDVFKPLAAPLKISEEKYLNDWMFLAVVSMSENSHIRQM